MDTVAPATYIDSFLLPCMHHTVKIERLSRHDNRTLKHVASNKTRSLRMNYLPNAVTEIPDITHS